MTVALSGDAETRRRRSATPARVVINVQQDLEWRSLEPVRRLLEEVLELSPGHVVLDLSGCRHADTTSIRMLVAFRRRLAARGTLLTVHGRPHPTAGQALSGVAGALPRRQGT